MQAGRRDWHFCLADELSLMDTQANDLGTEGHQSACTPIVWPSDYMTAMNIDPVSAVLALRQNPRDATLSPNRFSVGVMLSLDGATQVTRGRTTCMLDCAARRTRERDIHAAITRSVVGVRRVVRYCPCRRAGSNNTDEDADRHQHGTAFARCERVGRWGLAFVDRRELLRAANSTGLQ